MPTSGAKPSSPSDEVRIDVNGDDPAPPPSPPTPPPTPPPPPTFISAIYNRVKTIVMSNIGCIAAVVVLVSIVGLFIYDDSREQFPRFRLDSVSVSVDQNITAVWDIGYSMDRPTGHLDVWARFMSRDYKVESPGSAGNWTVSISALLPPGTAFPTGGLTLEQVVFKCNNYENIHRYVVEAMCKDVITVVRISSNETQSAMMEGGPIFCPIVYHDRMESRRPH